jgi:hypothetical protein
MTLREALSQIPDPRAHNRQYPLWGLLALILVAFLSRVAPGPPGGGGAQGEGGGGGRRVPVPGVSGEGGAKRGAYLFVLKGNQGELLEWALEVFKGMEERRLPGETEAVWNLVRDGEVWTYRVWASPYLPEEIRVFPGCG